MADASEDLLGTVGFQNGKSPYSSDPIASSALEDIVEDESTPDYRFITSKIPSRGVKDFEPHGTQLQTSTLEVSREAMFNVIREERTYAPGSVDRAIYDPKDGGAWCSNLGGKWATSVGKARRIPIVYDDEDEGTEEADPEQKKPRFLHRLYLLPEEVLWLLERGSIDLRWPAHSDEEEFSGMPVSLQAAHAILTGGSVGSQLTLEKFTVYQYLRRAGYVVFRAEDNWKNVPQPVSLSKPASLVSLLDFWRHLFTASPESQASRHQRQVLGPLVKPGLYRDYNAIYRQLMMIPYHAPTETPELINPYEKPEPSFPTVTYHVYKPNSHFRKTAPGLPEFYVSVINCRETMMPTESELEALLRQTPFHPPAATETNVYSKAKKGVRNVILAVVDQGLISFVNFSDAAFGANALWQRTRSFDPRGRGGHKGKQRR